MRSARSPRGSELRRGPRPDPPRHQAGQHPPARPTGGSRSPTWAWPSQVEDEDERVTRDGTTVGTVDYMAPEQARDSRATSVRSDIYSLGCTFYFLLTGPPPFPGGDITDKLEPPLHGGHPRPDERSARGSESPRSLIRRMMAKRPEGRFAGYDELIAAIDAARAGTGSDAVAFGPAEPIAGGLYALVEDERDADEDDYGRDGFVPLAHAGPGDAADSGWRGFRARRILDRRPRAAGRSGPRPGAADAVASSPRASCNRRRARSRACRRRSGRGGLRLVRPTCDLEPFVARPVRRLGHLPGSGGDRGGPDNPRHMESGQAEGRRPAVGARGRPLPRPRPHRHPRPRPRSGPLHRSRFPRLRHRSGGRTPPPHSRSLSPGSSRPTLFRCR